MWILVTILFLVATLLLHGAICRLVPERNRVIVFVLTGGVLGISLVVTLHLYFERASQVLAGTVMYAFCCEMYIFLFASTLTSISANLLLRLSERSMTYEEVTRVYDSAEMVKQRVERMLATDLVLSTECGSVLTHKGRLLLGLLQGLRRFFHPTLRESQ